MIKLAIATFLRTVSAPDRLNLEAPERERDFVLMLDDVARERNRQIIPQALFAHFGGNLAAVQRAILILVIFNVNATERITAVEYTEKQFVALVAIFSEKGGKVLHSRSFDLNISVSPVDRTDCVEYVVSGGHFLLAEVSCPLRYRRFLCHINKYYAHASRKAGSISCKINNK